MFVRDWASTSKLFIGRNIHSPRLSRRMQWDRGIVVVIKVWPPTHAGHCVGAGWKYSVYIQLLRSLRTPNLECLVERKLLWSSELYYWFYIYLFFNRLQKRTSFFFTCLLSLIFIIYDESSLFLSKRICLQIVPVPYKLSKLVQPIGYKVKMIEEMYGDFPYWFVISIKNKNLA